MIGFGVPWLPMLKISREWFSTSDFLLTKRVRIGAAAPGKTPCLGCVSVLEKAIRGFAESQGENVIVPTLGISFDTLDNAIVEPKIEDVDIETGPEQALAAATHNNVSTGMGMESTATDDVFPDQSMAEDVELEMQQNITATAANNGRRGVGVGSESDNGVFIDKTGMEALQCRPRRQIALEDKGKGVMEPESELESSDSDEDGPTRLARIGRNHARVMRRHGPNLPGDKCSRF